MDLKELVLEMTEINQDLIYARVVYKLQVKRPNKNQKSAEVAEEDLKKSMKEYNGKIFKKQGGSKYGGPDKNFEFAWLVTFAKYKDYYYFKHQNDDLTHTFIDSVDAGLVDKDWWSFRPKGITYK